MVAESLDNLEVLGMVLIWLVADEVQLMEVAVTKLHQGKGIGSALLEKALPIGTRQVSHFYYLLKENYSHVIFLINVLGLTSTRNWLSWRLYIAMQPASWLIIVYRGMPVFIALCDDLNLKVRLLRTRYLIWIIARCCWLIYMISACYRDITFANCCNYQLLCRYVKEGAGCGAAVLEVETKNLPAIALYQKFGFQEVGLRAGYYPNGADALLMNLPIEWGKALLMSHRMRSILLRSILGSPSAAGVYHMQKFKNKHAVCMRRY